jgi:ASC-1-like (ASCH) protein
MPVRHRMKLTPENFDKLGRGEKKFDARLNDEKRKALQVGERVEYAKLPELEKSLIVEIVSLDTYKNFSELYADHPEVMIGASLEDFLKEMYGHYTKEEEGKYGVKAIGIKLV